MRLKTVAVVSLFRLNKNREEPIMKLSPARLSLMVIAISGFIAACGGEPKTPSAATAMLGNDQTGVVGQQLASPLVVRVTDQDEVPMPAVTVSLTVTQGGGTVSPASGSTDENGQVSANWTLGTTAGESQQVRATVPDVSGLTAVFNATAVPDEAFVISMVAGDDQFAFTGTKLETPIVVKVRDRYANNVTGQVVAFTLPSGRGTVDSAVAFTDINGEALTGWTVGSVVGTDTAHAAVAGIMGSPVIFTATVHNLQITSVSPGTLLLGGTATLVGSGFSPAAADNTVTVGDLTAQVNSATENLLEISIPDACRPSGAVSVQVTVAGIPSKPVQAQLTPVSFLHLAVGEQMVLRDPAEFCLQFEAASAAESYLIGVQSVAEVASSRTPVKVSSVVGVGAAGPPALQTSAVSPRRGRIALDRATAEHIRLYARHRAAESRILQTQMDLLRSHAGAMPRSAGIGMIPPTAMVGDTVDIRVSGDDSPSCANFTEVRGEVMVVGDHGVWVADVDNPADGYTAADFQLLSDLFDDSMYDTEVEYFGQPTDLDGNGKIVMVATQEVNRQEGPAGFVAPLDFLARSECAASNEGEFVFLWVPDSTGSVGTALTKTNLMAWLPTVVAHEFVHVIQVGRRVQAGASLPSLWEMEGQATFGEEVVGHAVEGNFVGQNLSNEVAFDFDDVATSPWYLGAFIEMFYYYGMDDRGAAPVKLAGAPEDCSWLAKDVGHVCLGDLVYSPSWSLLRWLSDRFGSTFPGGEQGLQRALIDNTSAGFGNIEGVLEDGLGIQSVSMDTLLAQWAAMLYLDDRRLNDGTVVQVDPALTMSSWNLFSVFENTMVWDAMTHTLVPRQRSFAAFSDEVNVRGASSAYFIVSGNAHGATAIRARDASDQKLPPHMRFWVVRMK